MGTRGRLGISLVVTLISARPKRNGDAPWALADVEKKADYFRLRKSRGLCARGTVHLTGEYTAWSRDQIEVLKRRAADLLHRKEFSLAELKVHYAMADLLEERGVCFASVRRIAKNGRSSPPARLIRLVRAFGKSVFGNPLARPARRLCTSLLCLPQSDELRAAALPSARAEGPARLHSNY